MRCSVFIATSLDGFIARADGGLDWLAMVERAGEDYGFARFFDSIDTLVMGRGTYEAALGFQPWPYAGKRCVVLTHRSYEPRHGESYFAGTPEQLVAQLAASGAERVYVDGGQVIQQFLTAGLIDDLTVSVLPVLLGEGLRLFGPTGRDIPLALRSSRGFESGLVQLEYGVRQLG